jgi:hypothetical protein
MILTNLSTIAQRFCHVFLYGEPKGFNIDLNSVPTDSDTTILYHEGYIAGPVKIDQQGGFEPNYALKLCLLIPSEPGDATVTRRSRFEELEPVLYAVINELSKEYEISNLVLSDGVNFRYDKNLDGIRVTLNAKPNEVYTFC